LNPRFGCLAFKENSPIPTQNGRKRTFLFFE
jgi:hypothetical protein